MNFDFLSNKPEKKIGLAGIPTLTSLTALIFFSFESTEIILPVKMFSNCKKISHGKLLINFLLQFLVTPAYFSNTVTLAHDMAYD